MSLTGVFSYADLAAGYAGYRFWTDLLSVGGAGSLVAGGTSPGFVLQRRFSFSSYVTDAWDEAINCSTFHPDLGKEVVVALEKRGLRCPVTACHHLAALPDAPLYVNPACSPPNRDPARNRRCGADRARRRGVRARPSSRVRRLRRPHVRRRESSRRRRAHGRERALGLRQGRLRRHRWTVDLALAPARRRAVRHDARLRIMS